MKSGVLPFFMRSPSRSFLMSLLLLGTVLIFQEPARGGTIFVLRLPFTLLKACLNIALLLPRLPSVIHEDEQLRSSLIQRGLEIAQLRELVRKSQQADALVNAAPTSGGIVATVIGRSTIPTQQTVLLDKGKRHGITLDGVVVDASGVIGRVVELHRTSSLAMLLTDSESRVAALVERSRETGLLTGRIRGQCELVYLDAHADIEVGDRVVTAGLGGPFPKGLLLGKVIQVIRDEESGSASAWVDPAAELGRVEEVLCLPPSEKAEPLQGEPLAGTEASREVPAGSRSRP